MRILSSALLGVFMLGLVGCETTQSPLPPMTVTVHRLPPPPVYVPARASANYGDRAYATISPPRPITEAGRLASSSVPDSHIFPVSRERGNIAVRQGTGVQQLILEEKISDWSTIRARVANNTSKELVVDILYVPHDHRNVEIAEWRSGYQRVTLPPDEYVDVAFNLPTRYTRYFTLLVR
jgi:hypothetical protein